MVARSAGVSVTSAEIVRHFGRWQDHAATEPVTVTHHGRARLVMLSAAHYERLCAQEPPAEGRPEMARDDYATADALMEHVAQGFIAFDRDLRVRTINRAACCFLKAERATVVGERLDERLPGLQETLGYASLRRAANTGDICTLEMPSFAFEGRWLLVQTFPYLGGAACLFRDITEELESRHRTNGETALRSAIQAHQAIGQAKLSLGGAITDVDPAFAAFVGLTPKHLLSVNLVDLVSAADRSAAATALDAVLLRGSAIAQPFRLLTRAGTERRVHIAAAPTRTQFAITGALLVATAC